MPASVFIETSIPSAYVSTRQDASSVHRREATRQWWSEQLLLYEAWSSDGVVLELGKGDWPGKSEAIALLGGLPRLAINDEIIGVARRYIEEQLVPDDVRGDALHLAAASVNEFDYLLTWNIRHLANPNKVDHLTAINRRLGLLSPVIVTPEMLWLE
jgi:hypothetical protein